MASFRKLRRSIRCHLKHGTRCPHIERHSLRRPRSKRGRSEPEVPMMDASDLAAFGRHAADV